MEKRAEQLVQLQAKMKDGPLEQLMALQKTVKLGLQKDSC